ncbi:hypothetical protein [Streptococcus pneumoniae]|uniref:hypothetical protein n=1 Tax=Streptococcus pneumoniae TaxID=1313 RepID=UPI000B587226|nr:hypothetical protein [Streptococcus pneumoniae]
MLTKEQTRKLASGCSKHCFEIVDRTDEVSSKTPVLGCKMTKEQTRKLASGCSKHCFEVVYGTDEVSSKTPVLGYMELTKSVSYTYGKAILT